MKYNDRVLVTGGSGMVGHALVSFLKSQGFNKIYPAGGKIWDLRKAHLAENLFNFAQPDYVFHLAARVHGIEGNSRYKADILFDNVMINTNVVECCRKFGVKKIVAMGSGCVYPEIKGFLREDQIWLGPPHPSEDSYAHSKRLLLAQLQANKDQYDLDYAYAVSGNLYGEYDNFNEETGHVIPSLISKFYHAKEENKPVFVWGTGIAKRDFTYSKDISKALFLLMQKGEGAINVGSGQIHAIKEIVGILQRIAGVEVIWDLSRPDGQLERFYNLDKLFDLGFSPFTQIEYGISNVYNWYCRKGRE